MKAKVKANGRIIEVEKAMIGYAECAVANIEGFPMQNVYSEAELEFLPDAPEEVTIEGWVGRGANPHHLALYERKPDRLSDIWGFSHSLKLDPTFFPEVTWDTEPKRVKITITPIEE
ncbi:MAG: hypothetical protein HDS83_03115 [Bacteroidales bacterium]|nr:hypothetical protein [Bacteroidales bacterium]